MLVRSNGIKAVAQNPMLVRVNGRSVADAAVPDIEFVGTEAAKSDGSVTTTLAIDVPANVQEGDLLLAVLHSAHRSFSSSGWTVISNETDGSNVSVTTLFRLATGSEPSSYTFTANSDAHIIGSISAYRNVDPDNPIGTDTGATGTSTSITAPEVSTAHAGAWIVYAATNRHSSTPEISNPSGMTERDQDSLAIFRGIVADEEIASAGPTGSRTATVSSSDFWAAQLVELQPVHEEEEHGFHVDETSSSSPTDPTTTTIEIDVPEGTQENDFLLASFCCGNNGTPAITPPAGWTELTVQRDSNGLHAVYHRVAGDSEPSSYTWTLDDGKHPSAGMVAYRNVDPNDPIDDWDETVVSTSGQTQAVSDDLTTTVNNGLLVYLLGVRHEGTTLAGPAAMDQRWNEVSFAHTGALFDEELGASGSTGTRTASITGASGADGTYGVTVALKPAA